MQGGCHPEEEPEKQVFLHLCTDRHADLRKMRTGVQESHLGEKREKKVVWRCSNRLTNGVKKCGESETLEENALNRAVMEAIHRITSDDMEFMEHFRQNIIHVIGSYGTAKESGEYEEKIKEKQEEMVALIAENAKTGSYTPEFDERYRIIAEEINALKRHRKQPETRNGWLTVMNRESKISTIT